MTDAPTADGGPGFLAFVAFFLLALALWFLMRNMNARMRRMSYRQQAGPPRQGRPPGAPRASVDDGRAAGAGPTTARAGRRSDRATTPRRRRRGPAARPAAERPTDADRLAQAAAGPVSASEAATKCAANARIVRAWKTSWKPNQRGEMFGRLVP